MVWFDLEIAFMSGDSDTKARDNEVTKYIAAALDRLSTGSIIVGFVGPMATIMNDPTKTMTLDYHRWLAIGLVSGSWIAVSYCLHIYGKRALLKGIK
ncbi:hypothetical protein [Phyllobacterium zundukense]|jgi:hypothetical protein|uniref:Uncharacterized protein n=1 Tax=Phyllobacterium zundukense TaxID=1867719 RepID=A0ACD4D4B2_9HYPH|nr:hypothetical protein [Phyllobacterium zundukense]UXN60728.1 hypothetical protein N8E88_30345 [Phyllobacterium zundukense]